MEDLRVTSARSESRRMVAQLVIVAAVSLALGHCLRQPTQMGANDISRWCTVWSLLERGTYVIDDCPWQLETQDKVLREPKGGSGASPGKHFYSSKPALLADSDRRRPLPRANREWSSPPPRRLARAPGALVPEGRPQFAERGQRCARNAQRPRQMACVYFLF